MGDREEYQERSRSREGRVERDGGSSRPDNGGGDDSSKLFVGNLSYEVREVLLVVASSS